MPDLPSADASQDRAVARAIARWFANNGRDLPWRIQPRDPWHSLMSEIMLQQTQAARVAERFAAFTNRFPTPAAMAQASVDDVLAMWSGLGYYRRARMLHACATAIVKQHAGHVPKDPRLLKGLPGVGRYTAGAVASIAFGQPEPIVDGNVARVLLRLHGVDQPAESAVVTGWTWERASLLARAADGEIAGYSEGIMELGATVCTPRAPVCGACPVYGHCRARRLGVVDRIPRPKARAARKPMAISAIVVTDRQGRVLLEPRPLDGLWAGLWQPPCVERNSLSPLSFRDSIMKLGLEGLVEAVGRPTRFEFVTTHRSITVRVWAAFAFRVAPTKAARGKAAAWYHPAQFDGLGLGSAQRRMVREAVEQLAGQGRGKSGLRAHSSGIKPVQRST